VIRTKNLPARRKGAIDSLLGSDEPSIRWKARVRVLGEDGDSRAMRRLRQEIRRSTRALALIEGATAHHVNPYGKWLGSHWVLAALADIGHPGGSDVTPLLDEVLGTWLARGWYREVEKVPRVSTAAVPLIEGRYRRCASQQGSALLSTVRLGVVDERAVRLAELLEHWQWPDGGWNCDLRPEASSSSVYETLLPMRGLGAYAAVTADAAATAAARRSAEVLLERRVVFHRVGGGVIEPAWAQLHYPLYWCYDVLGGLKGLAEVGLVTDKRCEAALDLLESLELPDGGWPAQARYYRGSGERRTGYDHVDWGGVDARHPNPWVTVDALAVLAAAGRL
jgi:hypothetical protein